MDLLFYYELYLRIDYTHKVGCLIVHLKLSKDYTGHSKVARYFRSEDTKRIYYSLILIEINRL